MQIIINRYVHLVFKISSAFLHLSKFQYHGLETGKDKHEKQGKAAEVHVALSTKHSNIQIRVYQIPFYCPQTPIPSYTKILF